MLGLQKARSMGRVHTRELICGLTWPYRSLAVEHLCQCCSAYQKTVYEEQGSRRCEGAGMRPRPELSTLAVEAEVWLPSASEPMAHPDVGLPLKSAPSPAGRRMLVRRSAAPCS